MTAPTQAEKCRVIAEWLIPNFCGSGETTGNSTWGYNCKKCSMSIHGEPGGLYDQRHTVPRFYKSEDASALIREKLAVEWGKEVGRYFSVIYDAPLKIWRVAKMRCYSDGNGDMIQIDFYGKEYRTAIGDAGYAEAMAERAAKEKP